jgi:tRNA pseudouridine32 synthase/23S rRNA pseudouridine746 synthase
VLSVLYADEALVAVDKPAGLLVIPGRGEPETTVLDAAQAELGKLWVVHRLDRGTSGVLLFARSAAAHAALNAAFDSRRVKKRYLAVVAGAPPDEQRIEVPIAAARRGRMRPARPGDARAKAAATYVRVLEHLAGPPALALVECVPETGRTHQIRVHLMAAGTPLVVDPDYGPRPPIVGADGRPLIGRTPLHAASLAFDHPVSGAPLRVEAPLPDDIAALLERART